MIKDVPQAPQQHTATIIDLHRMPNKRKRIIISGELGLRVAYKASHRCPFIEIDRIFILCSRDSDRHKVSATNEVNYH